MLPAGTSRAERLCRDKSLYIVDKCAPTGIAVSGSVLLGLIPAACTRRHLVAHPSPSRSNNVSPRRPRAPHKSFTVNAERPGPAPTALTLPTRTRSPPITLMVIPERWKPIPRPNPISAGHALPNLLWRTVILQASCGEPARWCKGASKLWPARLVERPEIICNRHISSWANGRLIYF